MTQRKASSETMARLCEAVDAYGKGLMVFETINVAEPTDYSRLADALSAYRAETTPPLRSRAAKALDLLETLEIYMTISETSEWSNSLGPLWTQIEEIVGEPTAPEPAPSAEPYRVHDLRNTFTNHDQDTREERPCGCEEAEALKRSLREIRTEIGIWSDCHKSATATISAIALILRGEP